MALSNSRKKQLEQAKKNAKEKAKQKQNKALIQQYNATHKNAPKQTVSAKTNNRSTQKQASTPRRNAKNPRADSNHGIQTARHTASTASRQALICPVGTAPEAALRVMPHLPVRHCRRQHGEPARARHGTRRKNGKKRLIR